MRYTKFLLAFFLGIFLATSAFAFANQPIKLIVNGKEIFTDVPPQVINGRTMVPARHLAEALDAKVEWDEAKNAVVVTGGIHIGAKPVDLPSVGSAAQEQNTAQNTNINEKKEVNLMEWIPIRDLVEKYNIETLVSTTEIIVRGNGKEIKFNRQNQKDWQTTNNGINLKSQNGVYYMVESQLHQIGIIN